MAEVAVSLSAVSKRYRAQWALRDVSLNVEVGQAVGLIGANGAGKTTLTRLLLGIDTPDSGEVVVFGHRTTHRSRAIRRSWPRLVQVVWQDPAIYLNPFLEVGELLREVLPQHARRETGAVAALMESVGLPSHLAGRRPHELSGGQCQRVALARALAPQPRLLILDEALSNLDLPLQLECIEMLGRLRTSLDLTLLWVSHDLALTERLCDTVVFLHDGELVEQRPAGDLADAPTSAPAQAFVEAHWRLHSFPSSARPTPEEGP